MTAYAELDSPQDMRADAARVDRSPRLTPGLAYAEFPQDLPKAEISINEATARLATAFDRG